MNTSDKKYVDCCTGKITDQRLGITCENEACCLCDSNNLKKAHHLFGECFGLQLGRNHNYLEQTIEQTIEQRDIINSLLHIKGKHWRKFKKEVMVAAIRAIIYHTWEAKNCRLFKGYYIHR